MLKLLVLSAAGGIGTLARYGLAGLAHRVFRGAFPVGTLIVNLVGCLLIGAVMYLVRDLHALRPETRSFVVVGLLGGFTTFSAFGYETFDLVRAGSYALAGVNVAGNVVAGIAAVWLGSVAARMLFHG